MHRNRQPRQSQPVAEQADRQDDQDTREVAGAAPWSDHQRPGLPGTADEDSANRAREGDARALTDAVTIQRDALPPDAAPTIPRGSLREALASRSADAARPPGAEPVHTDRAALTATEQVSLSASDPGSPLSANPFARPAVDAAHHPFDDSSDELSQDPTSTRGEAPTPPTAASSLAGAASSLAGATSSLAGATSSLAGATSSLTRGAQLGRYVILDTLGRGGMGVVYEAYDPNLHRRVALKLLPVRSSHKTQSSARLLREAQALAQVAHPNVVSVYDIGVHDGNLFIAMELVAGVPLRKWLARARPDAEAIIAAFVAAGRGLSAIHDAGLVHRDFKPSNLMIGDDGRVRVLDLGVARTAATFGAASDGVPERLAEDLSSAAHGPAGEHNSGKLLARPLTRVGAVIGTLNYMAPEQHESAETDARSDQFSFCVTLWEALYGFRPFGGSTPAELKQAVLAGAVLPAPSGVGVPPHVHRALVRGLSRDPAARFPSMEALLSEIRTYPVSVGRRLLPALGLAMLAGVVAFAVLAGGERTTPSGVCTGGAARADEVWSDGVRQAMAAAFERTGAPYAADSQRRVAAAVDDYVGRWVVQRRQICEATRVHEEQSEEAMDRRMQCLDRGLDKLRATLAMFTREPTADVVAMSGEAARTLPSPAVCASDEALADVVPPPADPELRARIDSLRAELDEVEAMISAGILAEATPRIAAAVDEAVAVGYAPIEAQAQLLRARVQRKQAPVEAEATFHRAMEAAARARDDDAFAKSAGMLVWLLSDVLSRPDDALVLYPLAHAAALRSSDPEDLVRVLRARADIAGEKGEYDRADRELARAYELWKQIPEPEEQVEYLFLNTMGVLAFWRGNQDQALEYFARAARAVEDAFGPGHPQLSNLLHNMATIQESLGRYDDALANARRNLELERARLGPDSPVVAGSLQLLASIQADKGEFEAAERSAADALRIMEAEFGPDHARLAVTLINAGYVHSLQDEHRQARPYYERAIAITEASLGRAHPQLIAPLYNLGSTLASLDACDDAERLLDRSIEIARKANEDHPDQVGPLCALGECALADNKPRRAMRYFERAHEIATAAADDLDQFEVARAKLGLAQARQRAKKNRSSVRKLATEARELLLEADNKRVDVMLAEIDELLRKADRKRRD